MKTFTVMDFSVLSLSERQRCGYRAPDSIPTTVHCHQGKKQPKEHIRV